MTECKTCTKCKQSKTLAEFHKHKLGKVWGKTGLQNVQRNLS